mmetsp:Transcript_14465/g.17590  ORF Transcript_14465/g.17590 Transcript_14465/m.17590 type:complete len:194 (-) Transcript_14465:357-938(-)
MGIATLFMYAGLFTIAGPIIEKKLTASSSAQDIPGSFGIVILMLGLFNFWTIMYSMKVGAARTKYKEKAIKDGEKDAEARYTLPNLYVDGTTKPARAFNCVQRSHQQILETISQFNTFALVSGLNFPYTTSALVCLYFFSRIVWTGSYAASEGEPDKRYDHPLSKHIWTSLLALFGLSVLSGLKFMIGDAFFL